MWYEVRSKTFMALSHINYLSSLFYSSTTSKLYSRDKQLILNAKAFVKSVKQYITWSLLVRTSQELPKAAGFDTASPLCFTMSSRNWNRCEIKCYSNIGLVRVLTPITHFSWNIFICSKIQANGLGIANVRYRLL